jgi:hypothetical protein
MSQFGGGILDGVKGDIKGKGKEAISSDPPEEEETLGQRRKRLQAEREARNREVAAGVDADAITPGAVSEERPAMKKRLSMADILTAHPTAGANRSSSYNLQQKPSTGLLGMHERQTLQRSSTMPKVYNQQPMESTFTGLQFNSATNGLTATPFQNQMSSYNYGFGTYNNRTSTYDLGGYAQQQMMMPLTFTNPYASMGYGYGMGMGIGYQNPMAASMVQMHGLGQQLNQGQIDMVERWRQSIMQ